MTAFNTQAGGLLDADTIARRLNALESGSGLAPNVPVLFAAGTVGAPSISFAVDPTTGFYSIQSGAIGISIFGVRQTYWDAQGPSIAISNVNAGYRMGASANVPDVILTRDAANTLSQRNSTNAQSFNIYNTFTDASNSERGFVRWSGNQLQIGTEALGTGTIRGVNMVVGGLPVLFLNSIPSSVNYIGFAGGTTLAPVTISAAGTDTNVAIKLANQGTAITVLTGQTIGTTVGAAGAASALPATPAQYLSLSVNGTTYKVPLYN